MERITLGSILVLLLTAGCAAVPSPNARAQRSDDTLRQLLSTPPDAVSCRSMSVAEAKAVEEASRPPHFAGAWPGNCSYPFQPRANWTDSP